MCPVRRWASLCPWDPTRLPLFTPASGDTCAPSGGGRLWPMGSNAATAVDPRLWRYMCPVRWWLSLAHGIQYGSRGPGGMNLNEGNVQDEGTCTSPVKAPSKNVMSKLCQKPFFQNVPVGSLDCAFFRRDYTRSLVSALGSASEVYVSMVRDLRLPRLMYLTKEHALFQGITQFLEVIML